MAEIFSIKKNASNIGAVWKIDESEDELTKMLPSDNELFKKIKNIKNHQRKLEWLASRVLLYKHTNTVPIVEYTEIGKPFIFGLSKNISISHTIGYAAIVISESAPAGIDIERQRERILRIGSRFLHADESSFIPSGEEINYYTLIWCAKETLFKMLKRNDIIFNEELKILPFVIENEGVINVKIINNENSDFKLSYKITPEFHLVWHC